MKRFTEDVQKLKQILHYQKDREIRIRATFLKDVMLSPNVVRGCKREGKRTQYFYFWYKRWKASGFSEAGLKARSRAPKNSPNEIPEAVINQAMEIRGDKGLSGGKVAAILRRDHGIHVAGSTLCHHFRKRKISRIYRVIRKNQHTKRYACKAPLECVQTDSAWLDIEDNNGNRVYMFPVLDDCTRAVTVHVCDSRSSIDAVAALHKFVERFGKPDIVQTDNGVEFTAEFTSRLNARRLKPPTKAAFELECESLKIRHRLIRPRKPQLNGKVERFNGILKNELAAQLRNGMTFAEIQKIVDEYVEWYNQIRPHGSLKYLTPYEKFYGVRIAKSA